MALEVGIVGLPSSGKTTLFIALTRAGARVPGHATGFDKPHVGTAPIADRRLEQLAAVAGSPKLTPATLQVVDVPGTGAAPLGQLRSADALLAVVDGFSPGADPDGDLVRLELELLLADRDHVEKRLERVVRQAKSGDPKLRAEAADLEAILAHIDGEQALRDYPAGVPAELEPLTIKPLAVVVNGPAGIDCKLEAELAELEPEEAAEFREGRPSALEEVVRRLFEILDLVTFFTANENEARAWALRRGRTALEAASLVHSDLARGFIRCEVIGWDDLVRCGSHAEAVRQGLVRLEGKGYVVADGDVLNVRFKV